MRIQTSLTDFMPSLSENSISEKVYEAFKVFDLMKNEKRFVLAYSGGKDSTTVAILFYYWLLKNNIKGKEVVIIHEDTQSEFDMMENWARKFIDEYCKKIEEAGNACRKMITTPERNFYVLVVVYGYPASSYNFRWCVRHLKLKPNDEAMRNLGGRFVLILGHREEESRERAKIIRSNSFASCPLTQSCNAQYFLGVEMGNGLKSIPLRNWSMNDVWSFLNTVKDFDLTDLYALYHDRSTRFGCWHCTLSRLNKTVYNLPPRYLWLEALRIIYQAISELPEDFRTKKRDGNFGPLNALGRAIMLKLFPIVEERSGYRMYGLDEYVLEGYSLRQLFYEVDPSLTDQILLRNFRFFDSRFISMKVLREYKIEREKVGKIIGKAKDYNAYKTLKQRGDYVEELLEQVVGS